MMIDAVVDNVQSDAGEQVSLNADNSFVHVLVSVSDACRFVKSAFSDYVNTMRVRWGRSVPAELQRKALDYNADPFIEAMVVEIFTDNKDLVDTETLPVSTAILVKDGLELQAAQALAEEALRLALDCISSAIPSITLGNTPGVKVTYIGNGDLRFCFTDLISVTSEEAV